MTVQVRSYVEKDLPKLANLLNSAAKGSYEFMPLTEDELSTRIKDRKSRILIATDNSEIVGSVTYNDGYWGEEIRWLLVLERANQRFVENFLVTEAEKQVHGQTVFTSVDSGSLKMTEWAERGYAPDGGLYQMVAKLDSVRQIPPAPE